MKKLAAFVFTTYLAAAATPALATEPAPEPVPEPTVVYQKRMVIEFSEIKLSGEVVRPSEVYIIARTRTHFTPMLKVRTDFRDELLKSIDSL
jgi:hypothetical protein